MGRFFRREVCFVKYISFKGFNVRLFQYRTQFSCNQYNFTLGAHLFNQSCIVKIILNKNKLLRFKIRKRTTNQRRVQKKNVDYLCKSIYITTDQSF